MMIQPDKIVSSLDYGELVRICKDEDCTQYLGYALLIEPCSYATTSIEGKESEFDNDSVYACQQWVVEYLPVEMMPPWCTKEEIFTQKYLEGKRIKRHFYQYIGKWKDLKYDIEEI